MSRRYYSMHVILDNVFIVRVKSLNEPIFIPRLDIQAAVTATRISPTRRN